MSTALQTQSSTGLAPGRFAQSRYVIRRKFFKIFGEAFHIYDEAGQVLFYTKMKAFKLKEDLRVFTGEDMQEQVLSIQARNILDISATYDVTDPQTGQKVGALPDLPPFEAAEIGVPEGPDDSEGPMGAMSVALKPTM